MRACQLPQMRARQLVLCLQLRLVPVQGIRVAFQRLYPTVSLWPAVVGMLGAGFKAICFVAIGRGGCSMLLK